MFPHAKDVFLWWNYISFILIHLLSVSWRKLRFWVVFGRERPVKASFSDEQLQFLHGIWAQNEDLLLVGQFLCKIWENFVPFHIHPVFDVSTCKRFFFVKKLHLFHIYPPFECFLRKNAFLSGFGRERQFNKV